MDLHLALCRGVHWGNALSLMFAGTESPTPWEEELKDVNPMLQQIIASQALECFAVAGTRPDYYPVLLSRTRIAYRYRILWLAPACRQAVLLIPIRAMGSVFMLTFPAAAVPAVLAAPHAIRLMIVILEEVNVLREPRQSMASIGVLAAIQRYP